MDPLQRDNGVHQPGVTSFGSQDHHSHLFPQQQQTLLNRQGDDGPVVSFPGSAMWHPSKLDVKDGNAIRDQQFAAHPGTGGLGRAPVSVFTP